MDVLEIVKEKIISDFKSLIFLAEMGLYKDYSNILNMISYVESYNYLDNSISVFEKLMEL